MKIVYITNARLPTEKAHGVQIIKMNQAFSIAGHKVTLVHPWRLQREISHKKSIFDFYGVDKTFEIKTLNFLDPYIFRKYLPKLFYKFLSFSIDLLWGIKTIRYAKKLNPDLIMLRDNTPFSFLFASLTSLDVCIEFHDMPPPISRKIFKYALNKSKKIKCFSVTDILSRDLEEKFDLDDNFIDTLADAADTNSFDKSYLVKKKFFKPIITYCGSLSEEKGADILFKSAKLLTKFEIRVIGGSQKDILSYSQKYNDIDNVVFIGQVPSKDVPSLLQDSDLLVLPSSGKFKKSREYTSAMKLFEYLATGIPIVASDISSNSEILTSGVNSILFTPDDSAKLAEAADNLYINFNLRKEISKNALTLSKEYSWSNRCNKVLSKLKKVD